MRRETVLNIPRKERDIKKSINRKVNSADHINDIIQKIPLLMTNVQMAFMYAAEDTVKRSIIKMRPENAAVRRSGIRGTNGH